YTENEAATVIDNTITITDDDDIEIDGGTVTISTGFTTGDILEFTTQNDINGTYDSSTGVLTISGTASLSEYETALQSITYHSTSEDPTITSFNRTITWEVTDADSDGAGAEISTAVTSTITITPINDPPVMTADATLDYTENEAATVIDNTITITDADDIEIDGGTVTISSGFTEGDTLILGNPGSLDTTFSNNVLTITGTGSLNNYRDALRSITYHSTSEDPTITSFNRIISWTVTDANSEILGAEISTA
ncbi:uncharacterized protein METZ01_LOCUS460985, partial [marine metagenome]